MSRLDPHKLLANDPLTTQAFLQVIRGFLRRFLKDESRMREVSQSAFLEVLRKLQAGAAPKPEEMRSWVINCASNALRRELTRLCYRAIAFESRLHTRPTANTEQILDARRQVEHIEALLGKYHLRDRLALEAKIRGDSDREIATELGISIATVRCSVSRTRQRLRLSLTPEQKLQRLLMLAKLAARATPPPFRPPQDSSMR